MLLRTSIGLSLAVALGATAGAAQADPLICFSGGPPASVFAAGSPGGDATATAMGAGAYVCAEAVGGDSDSGKGGDARAAALASGNASLAGDAFATGGSSQTGTGGLADARADVSTTSGNATATANATGGDAGVTGGAQLTRAHASARSEGDVFSNTSTATASAISGRDPQGPGAAEASAEAVATLTPGTFGTAAHASAYGGGGSGAASSTARAVSAAIEVKATASAPVRGIAMAQSAAIIGGDPNPLPFDATWQAYAFGTGLPGATLVAQVVGSRDAVKTALEQGGLAVQGYGVMGSGHAGPTAEPRLYRSELAFSLDAPADPAGDLYVALLGHETMDWDAAAFSSASFRVLREGTLLFTIDFSELSALEDFFSDRVFALDLGDWALGDNGRLDLAFGFDLTASQAGSFGQNFLFAFGAEAVAVPEPGILALLGAGLAGISTVRRRRRTGAITPA